MLNIIFENQDVIVLNKPAGLLVHPTEKSKEKTLVHELIKYYPQIKQVGDNPKIRPGIVHRLDKDTSGILIIAKNQKAFLFLKKEFKKRKVKKTYLALVHGKMQNKQGIINSPISMSGSGLKRQAYLFTNKKSKPALTKWKLKMQYRNFALLKVMPKTGRTHQIRVHLKSINHPIAGDKLYKFKRQKNPNYLNRQFLHAWKLKINLPNSKQKEFIAPLPNNLSKVLQNLEK